MSIPSTPAHSLKIDWAQFGDGEPAGPVFKPEVLPSSEPPVAPIEPEGDAGERLREAMTRGHADGEAPLDVADLHNAFRGEVTPTRPAAIPAEMAGLVESMVRRLVANELLAATSRMRSMEEALERADAHIMDLTDRAGAVEARISDVEAALDSFNSDTHPMFSSIAQAEFLDGKLASSIAEAAGSAEALRDARTNLEKRVEETKEAVDELQARTSRNESRLQTVTQQIKSAVVKTAPMPPGAYRETPESSTMSGDDYTDPPTMSRASAPTEWSSWA